MPRQGLTGRPRTRSRCNDAGRVATASPFRACTLLRPRGPGSNLLPASVPFPPALMLACTIYIFTALPSPLQACLVFIVVRSNFGVTQAAASPTHSGEEQEHSHLFGTIPGPVQGPGPGLI